MENIYGYIASEEEKCPFFFDGERFKLRVYPASPKAWSQAAFDWFAAQADRHGPAWIPSIKLYGVETNFKNVCFCACDSPALYNGFREYDVYWISIHSNGDDIDHINGFRIVGGDLNHYLPAVDALEMKRELSQDRTVIEELTVSSKNQEFVSAGSYSVAEGIKASLSLKSFATLRNQAEKPINAESLLRVDFDKTVDIDTVKACIDDIRCFLSYCFYLRRISLPQIELYWKNKKGERRYSGTIVFANDISKPRKDENPSRITYGFWKENMGKMCAVVHDDLLCFQHLCNNSDEKRSYTPSRCFMIFAAFEREFRNIYGCDAVRSERYKNSKEEAIKILKDHLVEVTGKKKKDFSEIIKSVENLDDSYSQRVERALISCSEIMQPFVTIRYREKYEEAIKGISERMGELRNGFAHSRLDLCFDPRNLDDLKIMEELIYAIRLIQYNDVEEVKQAIKDLFNEKSVQI